MNANDDLKSEELSPSSYKPNPLKQQRNPRNVKEAMGVTSVPHLHMWLTCSADFKEMFNFKRFNIFRAKVTLSRNEIFCVSSGFGRINITRNFVYMGHFITAAFRVHNYSKTGTIS